MERVASDVSARLCQLSAELLPDAEELADQVTDRVLELEPRLTDPDDPGWVEAVRLSTHANVGAILSMLAYGIPGSAVEPSRGALELFQRLAGRDDGLAIVLRGYRLGHAELWQRWVRHVAQRVEDKDELAAILLAGSSHMHTYIDVMSGHLVEGWADARRARRQGFDVAPDALLREALAAADPADAVTALERLDYPAGQRHVAMTLPAGLSGEDVTQLAGRVRLVADGRSVVLRLADGWVLWLGLPAERAIGEDVEVRLDEMLAFDEPVGIGGPGVGVKGFRDTYREALDALRVGRLRGRPGPTRHQDVALLAVLCADTTRARALVERELGPLADEDETTSRLRETLAAYLACGESHVGAAERLHVHKKTVAYRIRQAEGLLGRRVGERRAELEAALLLHRAFSSDPAA